MAVHLKNAIHTPSMNPKPPQYKLYNPYTVASTLRVTAAAFDHFATAVHGWDYRLVANPPRSGRPADAGAPARGGRARADPAYAVAVGCRLDFTWGRAFDDFHAQDHFEELFVPVEVPPVGWRSWPWVEARELMNATRAWASLGEARREEVATSWAKHCVRRWPPLGEARREEVATSLQHL